MEPKCGGRNHTLIKPPKDSSITHKESDDLSLWASKLEELVKGFIGDLDDLKGESS